MTDYSDIVWVLRRKAQFDVHPLSLNAQIMNKSADAIEAQANRIAELEAALEPFAEQSEFIDDDNDSLLNGLCSPIMSKKDFFTASKVLGEKE